MLKILALNAILFACFTSMIEAISCNYYPKFPSLEISKTRNCTNICCVGNFKYAQEVCCGSESLWWISIIVIGAVAFILLLIVIFVVCKNEKYKNYRNKRMSKASIYPIPLIINQSKIKQSDDDEKKPQNYNSLMSKIAVYYLNSDANQPLPIIPEPITLNDIGSPEMELNSAHYTPSLISFKTDTEPVTPVILN